MWNSFWFSLFLSLMCSFFLALGSGILWCSLYLFFLVFSFFFVEPTAKTSCCTVLWWLRRSSGRLFRRPRGSFFFPRVYKKSTDPAPCFLFSLLLFAVVCNFNFVLNFTENVEETKKVCSLCFLSWNDVNSDTIYLCLSDPSLGKGPKKVRKMKPATAWSTKKSSGRPAQSLYYSSSTRRRRRGAIIVS